MTKADFVDWKKNPVTQQVFNLMRVRIEEIKEQLAHNAGEDSYSDAKKSGAILAFKELLEIDFEETHGN